MALVGHDQMYHIQRFIKQKKEGNFELAQRNTYKERGEYLGRYKYGKIPARVQQEFLIKYLPYVDTIKSHLKPVLEKAATKNTVVVMVCNRDQSALLLNFACACRAKGIQMMENMLIFPMDEETSQFAKELGFTVFYDEKIFKRDVNAGWGPDIFTRKVVAVHVVTMLGYDILFQDVDIVWYRDPLELFRDANHYYFKFDILFADDGARWVNTSLYSVNAGFFYARHNERTQHLFQRWLFALDLSGLDDQIAMNWILPEESSLTGLKIKVLDGDDFPCGNRIHRQQYRDFINDLLRNKRNSTYMLYVNWTSGNKKQYMKQMGLWYARESVCIGTNESSVAASLDTCCSKTPLVSCYLPDKPSVPQCQEKKR